MGDYGWLAKKDAARRATTASWPIDYMFALGLIIGGGTAQIQKNIIAERGLGMPREDAAAMIDFGLSERPGGAASARRARCWPRECPARARARDGRSAATASRAALYKRRWRSSAGWASLVARGAGRARARHSRAGARARGARTRGRRRAVPRPRSSPSRRCSRAGTAAQRAGLAATLHRRRRVRHRSRISRRATGTTRRASGDAPRRRGRLRQLGGREALRPGRARRPTSSWSPRARRRAAERRGISLFLVDAGRRALRVRRSEPSTSPGASARSR